MLLINGRYRVNRPLIPFTAFATSRLFEVQDNSDQSQKVLKILIRQYPELIALMQRERMALGLLYTPGKIPKVERDSYFTIQIPHQTLYCLVQEKVEGQNLLQWLESHERLSEPQAIEWLRQLTEILKIVHDNRFFHRDINPANIMLRPNGQLTLIDFGAVRRVTDTYLRRLRFKQDSDSMTSEDLSPVTAIGTPGYNPPEQVDGQAVPESDFFALGRTFVHLLTHQFPTHLPRVSTTGRVQWRDRAPQVSPPFADFLDRLMAPDWHDRPSTPEEILRLLNKLPQKIKRDQFIRSWQFKTLACAGGIVVSLLVVWGLDWQQRQENQRQVQQRQAQAQHFLEQGSQAQLSGKYEEARENYEQALKLNPNSANVHINLALLCQSQEKFRCAIDNYQKALSIEPNRPETLYNLGSLYDDLEDYTRARHYYQQLLSLKSIPGIDSKNNLSRIEIIQGNYRKAIDLASQARSETSDPISQAAIYKNLGWAEFKLGQYTQSAANLEESLRLESRADAYCLLAQVRQAQGRVEDSKIFSRQCLQRNDSTSKLPEVQQWRKQLIDQFVQ